MQKICRNRVFKNRDHVNLAASQKQIKQYTVKNLRSINILFFGMFRIERKIVYDGPE